MRFVRQYLLFQWLSLEVVRSDRDWRSHETWHLASKVDMMRLFMHMWLMRPATQCSLI